jgi:hypothetical protein
MFSTSVSGEHTMKTGTVFQHNNSQAVRLPAEARFPERIKEVSIRVVGQDPLWQDSCHYLKFNQLGR